MKIAYFGCDLYLDCLRVFESHEFTISYIFIKSTTPYNDKLIKFSKQRNIPLIRDKPTDLHIKLLESAGIELIFSCSYGWRIPAHQNIKYSMNIHPSLLPNGRGPNPLFWILRKYPDDFGITFHKISSEYDKGDLIYQEKLNVEKNDSLETLMMKLELNVPVALNNCLKDYKNLYYHARAQKDGSTWPEVSAKDIYINWHDPIEEIGRLVRCVGRFGAIAKIENSHYLISSMEYIRCNPTVRVGVVVKEDDEIIAISAQGGLAIIPKRSILSSVNEQALSRLI